MRGVRRVDSGLPHRGHYTGYPTRYQLHLLTLRRALDSQTGEHSPVEDARASMYVYLRYRKQWEKELRGGKVHAGQRAKRAKHMRSAP